MKGQGGIAAEGWLMGTWLMKTVILMVGFGHGICEEIVNDVLECMWVV